MAKRRKAVIAALAVTGVIAVAGIAACAPQANTAGTPEAQIMPQEDEYGVVVAQEWEGLYPDQVATYRMNDENAPGDAKHDYLQLYPELNTMYKGYAFALDYDEAASHTYSLESVSNTLRTIEKEQLANCITCKTPQFTALVNSEGDEVYTQKFNDTIGQFTEPISCYNCHENDPEGTVRVTGQYFVRSLGDDIENAPAEAEVCGQCHNEYYFDPETKVTTNPYTGLAAMSPVQILKYYDDLGYSDWTHPDTGAGLIKAQHPEFETLYGGITQPHMVELGYACSDCHMGEQTREDGTDYTSHYWRSPLENQELIDSTCSTCHDDLAGEIAEIQAASEERVNAIAAKIETYINELAAARNAGTLSGDALAQAQQLHREAQFYWDFVMVENSEGAHNPDLANYTLDLAEAAVDEGLALIG